MATCTCMISDMDKSTPIKNDLEMAVYFDCGDGEITSMLARCDGHQDCVSGADETGCNIDTNSSRFILLNKCTPYFFQTRLYAFLLTDGFLKIIQLCPRKNEPVCPSYIKFWIEIEKMSVRAVNSVISVIYVKTNSNIKFLS